MLVELLIRRLMRAPAFLVATAGTLTVGLGMVAVVYTVVQKILIEPMPYRNSDGLYYVWRHLTVASHATMRWSAL
ncbi:MAG: hypothetical protein GEV06_06475 [Luteitalea sp.]|nr:hypothetical protein [Luteitalea sp.]